MTTPSSCILFSNESECHQKLDIDKLFERKQKQHKKQLSIFNTILGRVHKRITLTNRLQRDATHILFTMPPCIVGEPLYNIEACLQFIIGELEKNGLQISQIYYDTILISWANYIPKYIRTEFHKQTGNILDEKGNITHMNESEDNHGILPDYKKEKEYLSTKEYKPSGVYNPDMIDKIEQKCKFRSNNNPDNNRTKSVRFDF